jgi:hypothetical protein
MTIANVGAYRVEIMGGTLDHVFVAQGTQGSPPPDYFACWGTNYVPSPHPPVVTGNINYNLANCYRGAPVPIPGMGLCPDTARIGVYGINGVCHQSANCFLFSARAGLNFSVLGYWLSLLAYGPYGTLFNWWLPFVYGTCAFFNPALAAEVPQAAAAEPSVVDKLGDLYASFQALPQRPDPHDVTIQEAETVVKHFEPGIDPAVYRNQHAAFLSEKDAVIATGITGHALADKINDLSKQLQAELSHRLDPAHYKRLSGADPAQRLNLIDPRLAAAAGVPVPR